MKIRAIVSTLLIACFVIVAVTGIGLAKSPSGRIAAETSWSFLGVDKSSLENLHTVTGFLMIGLVVIHLSINYRMYFAELKAFKKNK